MVILVYTTYPNEEEAKRILRRLLEKHLIACGNILPSTSIYQWKGAVEEKKEVVAILKTVEEQWEELVKEIKSCHSYDTPCIVKLGGEAEHAFSQYVQFESYPCGVTCILVDPQGNVILEKKPATHKYIPNCIVVPGGKMEPGETPEQAIRRELAEEFGITSIELELVHVDKRYETPKGYVCDIYHFITKDWDGVYEEIDVDELHKIPFTKERIEKSEILAVDKNALLIALKKAKK